MQTRLQPILMILASSIAAAACSGSAEPAKTAAEVTPPEPVAQTAQPASVDSTDERAVLSIAPDIAEACGIRSTETYFSYNSDRVQTDSAELLQSIVTCFTTGPLAGQSLYLVGHADPRGDEEYNWALGGRRASKVQGRLEELGFPKAQVSSTSRGESDASGTDETGWRYDRKVELKLAT